LLRSYFFKAESSGDIGTSVASMNRTAKVTAKKGPYDEYNAKSFLTEKQRHLSLLLGWNLQECRNLRVRVLLLW